MKTALVAIGVILAVALIVVLVSTVEITDTNEADSDEPKQMEWCPLIQEVMNDPDIATAPTEALTADISHPSKPGAIAVFFYSGMEKRAPEEIKDDYIIFANFMKERLSNAAAQPSEEVAKAAHNVTTYLETC